jgi:glutathione S-transferase
MREKGLEFETESVNIMPMPDWFLEISPARRIPVLRDTSIGVEGPAGTIPDSSAICAFIERLHPEPAVYPEDAYARGRAVWYEEWADTELAQAVGLGIFRPIMFPIMAKKEPDLDTAKKTWNEKLPRLFDYLEGELDGEQGADGFLVGASLSIGDVGVACQLAQLDFVVGPPDKARWPLVVSFLETITSRPSFLPMLTICRKIVKQKFDLSA